MMLRSEFNELKNLKLNCEYWDVRIEDSVETAINVVDGEVTTCLVSPSLGAFLRVRKNGFWLYEATTDLTTLVPSLKKLAEQNPKAGFAYKYSPASQAAFFKLDAKHRAFNQIPLELKFNLTKHYSDLCKKNSKVVSLNIHFKDIYKIKSYLNSVNTAFEYDFNQAGFKINYVLKDKDKTFQDHISIYGSDFEQLKNKDSEIIASLNESEKFLMAPAIAPGKYKVLLDPVVAGVFTHESFGHKSEADFILGDPQALEDWKIGTQIGSSILSIVDCGLHENTSGYCPIDDDGFPAQKNYLIKNGILSGRLHSQDTAFQLDEKPTGNSRALSFEFEPIVRMTSTYIEPGEETIESILKRSEGCLLLEGFNHGSGLSTFTIAPTRGYLIGRDGDKTPVRVSVISGSVFETLKNIEAVSDGFELKSYAIGGCGKMEQFPLPVADGGPYVLIKEMQVS